MPQEVVFGNDERFQVIADWYLPDRERYLLRDIIADETLLVLNDDVKGARRGLINIAKALNEINVHILFTDRLVLKFLLRQVVGEFTAEQIAAETNIEVDAVRKSLEKLKVGGFLP